MESYRRDFSWHLPVAEGTKQPDKLIDYQSLITAIKNEILEAASAEEKIQLLHVFQVIDMATLIISLGCENEPLERGAIELRRILPALVAFHFELDTVVLFDELAQLYMKGGFVPCDADSYELNEADAGFLEGLGTFGYAQDQFNEQYLSADFYPIVDPQTPIGDFTAQQVSDWLVLGT